MTVNYEDERFQKVETEKQEALSQVEKTYSGLMDQSDAFYQNQIDATNQWEEEQKNLQQEQTDFALEQIEQQKEQAEKDYTREQSGAYVDWQKQSNQYGANAEKLASAGMAGTGYAESSQVAMYNAYQARVATARENFRLIIQDYDNDMTQARLQNNAALAQIAYDSLQKRLELELQSFLHKSELELQLQTQKQQTEDRYYARYQDVLAQINQENALAEQIRQYNASLAEDQRQFNASLAASLYDSPGADTPIIDSTPTGSTLQSWEKSTNANLFTGSTYKEATEFLKKHGVLGNVATDLMSESKWNYLKKNGDKSNSVRMYGNYASYVRAFVNAAIEYWG